MSDGLHLPRQPLLAALAGDLRIDLVLFRARELLVAFAAQDDVFLFPDFEGADAQCEIIACLARLQSVDGI